MKKPTSFDEIPGLSELRKSLDDVDARLIETIAERQRLVEEIGVLKTSVGHQTRDFTREKVVLEGVAKAAVASNLEPEVAREVLSLLIRSSLQRQEKARLQSADVGGGKTALVIGGEGRMGRWFAEFLHSQSFQVYIADPTADTSKQGRYADWEEAGTDFDVIVIAATLAVTSDILEGLVVRQPRGLVFDVGSLKTPLRGALERLAQAGVSVTSVHPMFGPSTQLLADRQVIFVDVGAPDATKQARELFASTMANCIDMDIDEHDQLIAFVLGLSHLTTIVFSNALSRSGIEADKLLALSSPTFDAQLHMGRTVVHENPHLYFEIQKLNDLGARSQSALRDAVGAVLSAIQSNDKAGFVEMMNKSSEYFDGGGD